MTARVTSVFLSIFSAVVFLLADFWRERAPALKSVGVFAQIPFLFDGAELQWLLCTLILLVLVGIACLQVALGVAKDRLFLWLGLTVLASSVYFKSYADASGSTDFAVLIGSILIGQVFASVARWQARSQEVPTIRCDFLKILLLALAVVPLLYARSFAQYHGIHRWAGPLRNPNLFGILMGVGIVCALGQAVKTISLQSYSRPKRWEGTSKMIPTIFVLKLIFYVLISAWMAIGLYKSLSRGAWLGLLIAVCFFVYESKELISKWAFRYLRLFLPIFVSILAFGVLYLQDSNTVGARRIASVVNVNDFSWRNRLEDYRCGLQVIGFRQGLGLGWNIPEKLSHFFYEHPRGGSEIPKQLNNYLLMGMTVGSPALLCFVGYIWLSLRRRPDVWGRTKNADLRTEDPELRIRELEDGWLRGTCRAAVIVLLVGFWFNGGLFKMAVATPFWVLLELGAAAPAPISRANCKLEGSKRFRNSC